MATYENMDIRQLVSESGLTYKAIAAYIGITPEHLSKCMRYPLSHKMYFRIVEAIRAMYCGEKIKESRELKRCPFCGGGEIERSVDGGILPSFLNGDEMLAMQDKRVVSCTVRCKSCGAQMEGYAYSDDKNENLYEKAIDDCYAKWNRRVKK